MNLALYTSDGVLIQKLDLPTCCMCGKALIEEAAGGADAVVNRLYVVGDGTEYVCDDGSCMEEYIEKHYSRVELRDYEDS